MADDRLNMSVMSGVERNLNARQITTNFNLQGMKSSAPDDYVNSPALKKMTSQYSDQLQN